MNVLKESMSQFKNLKSQYEDNLLKLNDMKECELSEYRNRLELIKSKKKTKLSKPKIN